MNTLSHLFKTYRQAPWRTQRQWITLFLIGLIALVMVAVVNLGVTARAALDGREIQRIEAEISVNRLTIADLETQLAGFNSAESMRQRALELGFRPAEPEDRTYIPVPGYSPRNAFTPQVSTSRTDDSVNLPEYTESLFDWLSRSMTSSSPAGGWK